MEEAPRITGLDHIVLAVADVDTTCDFYQCALGLTPVEHSPGRWALAFGSQKISLQPAEDLPEIASGTKAGSGNFCLLTEEPITNVVDHLSACGIDIVLGPAEKVGATGPILSVYFHDPDGNLVEVGKALV